MQLLLRRRIFDPQVLKLRFVLWAKFELTSEEARLLNHYHVATGYLTIEHSRADLIRAVIFSFFISLIATGLLVGAFNLSATAAAIAFLIMFVFLSWGIYEQLREAIRIGDMLAGREFKHKSLVLMARRERRMIGYAHAFIQFLEKLKEWEGTEIIEIGEEHEPALRLVTDTYAPA